MKTIAWLSKMYILGDHTIIDVGPRRMTIDSANLMDQIEIRYQDDISIDKRMSEDDLFKNMLPAIVGNVMAQFLSHPGVAVLDLRTTLWGAKVQENKVKKFEEEFKEELASESNK